MLSQRTQMECCTPIRGCVICHADFHPARSTQKVCSLRCAAEYARLKAEKREARAAKDERKADRVRKEALKTRSDYIKDAQKVANSYVRARDRAAGHPCISSGRPLNWAGNDVDAGHYRSVGSAPQLRFHLWNIHAQSKHDNQWKSGNAVDYRINLIARIGVEKVEALEADQSPRKHDIEWLKRFTKIFRAKTRRLEKRRGK